MQRWAVQQPRAALWVAYSQALHRQAALVAKWATCHGLQLLAALLFNSKQPLLVRLYGVHASKPFGELCSSSAALPHPHQRRCRLVMRCKTTACQLACACLRCMLPQEVRQPGKLPSSSSWLQPSIGRSCSTTSAVPKGGPADRLVCPVCGVSKLT